MKMYYLRLQIPSALQFNENQVDLFMCEVPQLLIVDE